MKNIKKLQYGNQMSNFIKFFLGFIFIAFMFDLMLIDRKKNMNNLQMYCLSRYDNLKNKIINGDSI